MPGRLFGSSGAKRRLSWSGAPTQGFKVGAIMAGMVLLASCGPYDRANQARAAEIDKLQHETFAQAAEPDRCADDSCVRQEAGFAYAKKNNMANPAGCSGKGDDGFVEGCRQYGQDIEQAYLRFAAEG
jgi:hypothetical protein